MAEKISELQREKNYRGHIISSVPVSGSGYKLLDIKDGYMKVADSGKIVGLGPWSEYEDSQSVGVELVDTGNKLIMPGFVDMHIHLPQVTETGRSGQHLLAWLEKYIFPAETRFKDPDYAYKIAQWFFKELLRNGTTTACVFTTIHKESTDRAFEVAEKLGVRVIMGKVMMDRNSPSPLTETVSNSIDQSVALYERWHMKDDGRLRYAFTPRFAVTSTPELLEAVGRVWSECEGAYLHTHLAESIGEVEFVKQLFDWSRSYVDVYKKYGLTGPRSIFAHSIHLDDDDLKVLKQDTCSLAHCPSSNFFLKSGIFGFRRVREAGVKFGLGSDVAAGPQMSIFQVMKDANYIQPEEWLEPGELFYRATLGGAIALGLDSQIGSLEVGKDADFIIVDPTNRNAIAEDMLERPTEEILASLVFLGDDRCVESTYVRGLELYSS